MMGTYCMRVPRDLYTPFTDDNDRAVALAGTTPELRVYRGHAIHVFERKFAEAEFEFLQARREKPSLKTIYGFLAMLYVSTGRFADAFHALTQGYKVDPLWPVLPAIEVSVHFFARDFEAAVACGRKSVELHPYVHIGRCFYAQALEYSGRGEEALREYRMACIMSPGLVWPRVLEAACFSKMGRQSEAAAMLQEIARIRETEYVDAYYLALLYDSLGMRDQAFAELQRAYEDNSFTLCLLAVDPKMDSLRHDPRFAALRQNVFSSRVARSTP